MPSRIKILVALLVALATVSSLSSETLRTRADSIRQAKVYLTEARRGEQNVLRSEGRFIVQDEYYHYDRALEIVRRLDSTGWEAELLREVYPKVQILRSLSMTQFQLTADLYEIACDSGTGQQQLDLLNSLLRSAQQLPVNRKRWLARREASFPLLINMEDYETLVDWYLADLKSACVLGESEKASHLLDSIQTYAPRMRGASDVEPLIAGEVAAAARLTDHPVLRRKAFDYLLEIFGPPDTQGTVDGRQLFALAYLAIFYLDSGQDALARRVLQTYLESNSSSIDRTADSLCMWAEWLGRTERIDDAVEAYRAVYTFATDRLRNLMVESLNAEEQELAAYDSIMAYVASDKLFNKFIRLNDADSVEVWAGKRKALYLQLYGRSSFQESPIVKETDIYEDINSLVGDLYKIPEMTEDALELYERDHAETMRKIKTFEGGPYDGAFDQTLEDRLMMSLRGLTMVHEQLGHKKEARQFFDEWEAHADTLLWYDHLREIDSLKQAGFLE